MRNLLLALAVIFCSQTYGQQYKMAYVIDVNYSIIMDEIVDSVRFPFYFHHKEFVADVQYEIRVQLIKKF